MRHRFRPVPALLSLFCLTLSASAAEPTAEQVEFFEKKVRPVLAETCQQCHGPKKQRGGLTLDNRDAVLKGGDSGAALVPGEPEKSRLVRAIRYDDVDLRMPPRGKLTDQQIADLAAWVKMGAPWPGDGGIKTAGSGAFDLKQRLTHWCWQSVKPTTTPAVKDTAWVRNPIDAFILARLEAEGLKHAAAADRRTWLRRVTFDLIGLPPTPAEIDAFLADTSADADEKVVERLLASPHYGERWGRHWLDLVRYAETQGHEFDYDIADAWRYRDYVIRAFNDDLPYDRFVTEHVAGDLVPDPRRHPTERFNESILATGFWHLGEAKHSPVDVRQDCNDRLDNQIDVFGKAFLGLTVACARCHDHKFDPIPQTDYYALMGYLRSSRFQRAFISDPKPTRKIVRQLEAVRAEARRVAVAHTAAVLGEFVDKADEQLLDRDRMLGVLAKSEGFTARRKELLARWKQPAGNDVPFLFEDFSGPNYDGWFVTGEAFGVGPDSDVEVQPHDRLPVRGLLGPGVARSDRVSRNLQGALRSSTFTIDKNRVWYRVAGQGTTVNLIIDGFQLIRAPIYGGLTFAVNSGERFEWRAMDVSMWKGHRAYVEVLDDGPGWVALDQVVFSDGGSPPETPNPLLVKLLEDEAVTSPVVLARKYQELVIGIVRRWAEGKPTSADEATLLDGLLRGELRPAIEAGAARLSEGDAAKLAELQERRKKLETSLPLQLRAPTMADGTGEDERLHIRGSHKNLGDAVPRRTLVGLGGDCQPPAQGSGRLELARRLVDPAKPLTARVMVNRLWQHHFGAGLVRSVDNFGVLGETPSHPELLDWLAGEFVRRGWSLKKMHRLMVLSNTYRMASRADDPKAEEKDPQNRLWHRAAVRRLEAETVHDAMLAVSGRLDRKMYGPGVMPHLTPFMEGRGRPGASGPLDGDGRRGVYLIVRRNFLNPMFLAFDYPVPFTTMGRRSVSNVPAQALTLLNNPFVVQQAQLWARRALAEPGKSPAERVRGLYVAAFGRPPTEEELTDALAFLAAEGKGEAGAAPERAWADLCHVLFNVKEFIFVG